MPVSIAPDALDFRRLIGRGETVGWAEATAEPLFLTRLLDAQAARCPPFRVFFPLTFSDGFAVDHPNVAITALGGASAGRRFFAKGADNVVPANISDVRGLVASGRLPIDIVLLQVTGPDDTGRYNAGLGIEHLHAAIGRARLVIAQVNPELPWTYGDTVIEPGLSWCRQPRRRSNCRRGRPGRSSARSRNMSPGWSPTRRRSNWASAPSRRR
jgi:acetyl-CoA hydrolase